MGVVRPKPGRQRFSSRQSLCLSTAWRQGLRSRAALVLLNEQFISSKNKNIMVAYQILSTPRGLITALYGPVDGHCHDVSICYGQFTPNIFSANCEFHSQIWIEKFDFLWNTELKILEIFVFSWIFSFCYFFDFTQLGTAQFRCKFLIRLGVHAPVSKMFLLSLVYNDCLFSDLVWRR